MATLVRLEARYGMGWDARHGMGWDAPHGMTFVQGGQCAVGLGLVFCRASLNVRRVFDYRGGSSVRRDRPQNVMAEANLDVPFHCDAAFSMPPSIEM